ncbi:MAG: PBP1A family penicillin-binding protein [Elusimicrobiota bacterium]|jgi:penicillin-binding protein 1A|nr:PBP1A family penicillin-binding protein [Elusimicrobiota bacterium]
MENLDTDSNKDVQSSGNEQNQDAHNSGNEQNKDAQSSDNEQKQDAQNSGNEQNQENTKNKWITIPLIVSVLFIAICIIVIGILLEKTMTDLPSAYQIENFEPNLSAKIYDNKNNLIAEFFTERRTFVPIHKIPKHIQNAFVAIEDNDFYNHWGVSVRGIARAASRMVKNVKVSEGGSTITQQLARMMFLNADQNMSRKLKEMLLAIQIESIYSKDEIMQSYVNQAYFGFGAYGAHSAALTYFKKDIGDLTLGECAIIAAIPKSPNYYNPFKDPKASLVRRNLVLAKMRELGYITQEQEEEALKEPLPVQTADIIKIEKSGDYFIEYIRIMLANKYGLDELYTNGFSVYTTFDMKMQKDAEVVVENMLSKFDRKRAKYFKRKKIEPVKVQGALLAIDAKTGAIKAMVGGRDFKESEFNRAVQAKRQPGSSFKPFVYLAALEEGYSPGDTIEDRPMIFTYNKRTNKWTLLSNDEIDLENMAERLYEKDLASSDKIWKPLNYDRRYRGEVTIETALALSINTCAIELIRRVSPRKVIAIARRLGISSYLIDSLSLALGVSEVTLHEMVGAYTVFAAGGMKMEPYVISKIEDRNGSVIEEHIHEPIEIVSAQTSFIMTNMLKSVVQIGSARDALRLGRQSAGKTGTTNDFADAWFIGYTNELVTGVWVGYDDRRIDLGNNAAGGIVAAPIWTNFMKKALAKTPPTRFRKRVAKPAKKTNKRIVYKKPINKTKKR